MSLAYKEGPYAQNNAHVRTRRDGGALVATPIAVYATHQFTDVSDSAFFSNSVTWMKDNGITVGCNPPANTKYCPNDNVSRGEMAVFVKRLSEKNVADAGELQGFTAAELTSGAAFNSVADAPDGADFTLSTEITAPAPRILLISGGIQIRNASVSDTVFCWLEIDDVIVLGSDRIAIVDGGIGNVWEECTPTGAAAVAAGTYTIDLEVGGVDRSTILTESSVWVLWVPLDGTGAIPPTS